MTELSRNYSLKQTLTLAGALTASLLVIACTPSGADKPGEATKAALPSRVTDPNLPIPVTPGVSVPPSSKPTERTASPQVITPTAREAIRVAPPIKDWREFLVPAAWHLNAISSVDNYMYPPLRIRHIFIESNPDYPVIVVTIVWNHTMPDIDPKKKFGFQPLSDPFRPHPTQLAVGIKIDIISAMGVNNYNLLLNKSQQDVDSKISPMERNLARTIEPMQRPDSLSKWVMVFEQGLLVLPNKTTSPESTLAVKWQFDPTKAERAKTPKPLSHIE
jgi:hypothetical protein